MKTRNKIILIIAASAVIFAVVIMMDVLSVSSANDRESLKEVVYSNTDCARYWRVELLDMWNNQTYDYKNDPIFQECYEALQNEN